jgi:hypothetical protein
MNSTLTKILAEMWNSNPIDYDVIEKLLKKSYKAGEEAGKKLTEEQFNKVMAGIKSLTSKENE